MNGSSMFAFCHFLPARCRKFTAQPAKPMLNQARIEFKPLFASLAILSLKHVPRVLLHLVVIARKIEDQPTLPVEPPQNQALSEP
jgi:hypothetical protein